MAPGWLQRAEVVRHLAEFLQYDCVAEIACSGIARSGKRDCLAGAKRRLERRTRSSRGKCRPEHGQAANGRFLCRFVLDDVPVLGKLAVLETHYIRHDPVRRQAHARESAVEQHVVSVGHGKPVLVMQATGYALDQSEEALTSRRNVRAVLNVVRRPEALRSGVVPLVEKRFESLQHEGLILFVDCPRHFILLRYTSQTRPCGKARPPASVS